MPKPGVQDLRQQLQCMQQSGRLRLLPWRMRGHAEPGERLSSPSFLNLFIPLTIYVPYAEASHLRQSPFLDVSTVRRALVITNTDAGRTIIFERL